MSYHTLSPTPPIIDVQKMYSISQVRKLLGTKSCPISRATLWRYRRHGLIQPTEYVGKELRFKGESIVQCWNRCMNLRFT